MKKFTLTLFLLLLALAGFARQRTESEALSLARSFYSQSSKLRSGTSFTLAYTGKDDIKSTRSASVNVYYYVFNTGENNGFVIVSGDDRAKAILGYSAEGAFDINTAPENFKYWLGFYQQELELLLAQPETEAQAIPLEEKNLKNAQVFATSISPLLGNIKWDQDSPYNDLCPQIPGSTSRSATGCVATGMAQIMKYHNWPDKGVGSNTYTPSGYPSQSVNFGNTTYNWAAMTPTYGASSTAAQKTAVATLMYHCGVATNMNYGASSGTQVFRVGQALVNYFKYDSSIQLYSRNYYSKTEWQDMIKTELNAARPVLYSGNSTDVGHLFVCDGYDSNNLFHINWGWKGSSNGYYELSALNPPSLGIGGGAAGGFNFYQQITVGIQKATAAPTPSYVMYMNPCFTPSANSVSRNASFSLTVSDFFNLGVNAIPNLSFRYELRNSSGSFMTALKTVSAGQLPFYNGWNSYPLSGITIPGGVTNGSYRIYLTYKDAGQTEWSVVRTKTGTPQCLKVDVTSSSVTFSKPTDTNPVLSLSNLATLGNLYQNKTGRFTATVTNTGTGDYNSYLALYLSGSNSGIVTQDPVVIAVGETKTFDLEGTITLAAGNYSLLTLYDKANDIDNATTLSQFGASKPVTVLPTPAAASLSIVSQSFPYPSAIYQDNIEFRASIRNTGGAFIDQIRIVVFTLNESEGMYHSVAAFGAQFVNIENETKNLVFTGELLDLEPGTYYALVYYHNGSWTRLGSANPLSFNLKESLTGIGKTISDGKAGLYPNPASDVLYLKSEEVVKSIRIADLSGKQILTIQPNTGGEISIPIEKLASGAYILQLVTDRNRINYKFIKK
ncbi:thiol protease/hemagglutinin PrtT [Viscerimonas tarda]